MAHKDLDYCQICGEIATDTHHLLGGRNRTLCDIDHLTIKICRQCHTTIHNNGTLELKCKAVGQSMYELKMMVEYGMPEEIARARFMERYGKNYF